MRHVQQRQKWSWHELPILPGAIAVLLAIGLFYAQASNGTRPDGVGPQVREVNTVTTGDAECTWGADKDGYQSGATYAATIVATATIGANGHINSWQATLSLTGPGTLINFPQGTATDVIPNSDTGAQTGTPPNYTGTEFSWGNIANNGTVGLDLGSDLDIHIPAFDTYRALDCTAKLTGTAGNHGNDLMVDPVDGSDTPTCGTDPLIPCQTIGQAQTRATSEGRTNVLLVGGTYNESVTLVNGQTIKGGYTTDFSSQTGSATVINGGVTANNVTANVDQTTINGPGGMNTTGVVVTGTANVTLTDNIINSGTPSGSGSSAYGVRLQDSSTVTVSGGSITAQGGVSGADASAAKPGVSSGGCGGSSGDIGVSGNENAGADGGADCSGMPTPDQVGRKGGNGSYGHCDSWCGILTNWTYPDGQPGTKGGNNNGGAGGTGGKHDGDWGGAQATSGWGGNAGTGGTAGNGGTNSLSSGPSLWAGGSGSTGGIGGYGYGGGGGGGGRSARTMTLVAGGGGGGGGGGGSNGGTGATEGGHAGGGSFGIYATGSATLNISSTSVTAGNGGVGGKGSDGGNGGNGGVGGNGGDKYGITNAGEGGGGGGGGAGGGGGGAGGGPGGPSIPVYFQSSGTHSISASLTKGTGGTGGSGGSGGSGGTGGTGGCNSASSACSLPTPPSGTSGTGPGGWARGGYGGLGGNGANGNTGQAGQAYQSWINGTATP